jgi:hypothetical protein
MTAADFLHERVPSDHDHGSTVGIESTHGAESALELTVVGFDPVVPIPLGAMPCLRSEFVEQPRVNRRPVGGDLTGLSW